MKMNRRDFLKLGGAGAAALTVLTGCGPMARFVTRKPYFDMPEYNHTGFSTYFATTCQECPAGCGLVVRTQEGRAIKIEGSPKHPVNSGKICSRGLTSVEGLYNPDRLRGPQKNGTALQWDAAVAAVAAALKDTPPDQIAFLVGQTPDHMYDLFSEVAKALGAPSPIRCGALGMFEARATLENASSAVFGQPGLPFFDIGSADLVISFGADFLETWLSPVAYSRGYHDLRTGKTTGRRGQLVAFDSRQSLTASNADVWLPVIPGSEALAAQALGRLISERITHSDRPEFKDVDVPAALKAAGLSEAQLQNVLDLIAQTMARPNGRVVFLPGGSALAHGNGLLAAISILTLNDLVGGFGVPGGVFLAPVESGLNSFERIKTLVDGMQAGVIKTLFIHGCNPVFELPSALGFEAALKKVSQVFSFASFPDETSQAAGYVLPDHTPLESWGYQRILAGSDRPILSAVQPVVVPLYDTRSSADVVLAAVQSLGGPLVQKVAYKDVVDFLQQKLAPYLNSGGIYTAPEILTFWSLFLQNGGWWTPAAGFIQPKAVRPPFPAAPAPRAAPSGKFHLLVYPTQMGDGHGANRPWLQETPNPLTTVEWNTWVEIHPDTAAKLGLQDDDVVVLESAAGKVEAVVYLYPAIRPDTVALPFGQGHTALGRYAKDRGTNPAGLLELVLNEAGDLACGDTLVTLTPTGRRRPLARAESRPGVYGEK